MAVSFREAFALAGIEGARDAELEVDGTDSTRSSDWGFRLGIPEPGISRHAAERYRERFGNDRDALDVARDQLRARLDNGSVTFSRQRPSWLVIVPRVGGQIAENSAGYLIVDDEIALPIRKGTSRTHPYYIVTCMYRTEIRA